MKTIPRKGVLLCSGGSVIPRGGSSSLLLAPYHGTTRPESSIPPTGKSVPQPSNIFPTQMSRARKNKKFRLPSIKKTTND